MRPDFFQRVTYEAVFADARKQFGEPNQSNTKAHVGLKRSHTENLFYGDCALRPKDDVRILLQTCDPNCREALQWEIMHPGMPGRGLPFVTVFDGSWDDIAKALR
jgi:hypothetical protein